MQVTISDIKGLPVPLNAIFPWSVWKFAKDNIGTMELVFCSDYESSCKEFVDNEIKSDYNKRAWMYEIRSNKEFDTVKRLQYSNIIRYFSSEREKKKIKFILDYDGYGFKLTSKGVKLLKECKASKGIDWERNFIIDKMHSKEFRSDEDVIALAEQHGLEFIQNSFYITELIIPDGFTIDDLKIEQEEAAGFQERIILELGKIVKVYKEEE